MSGRTANVFLDQLSVGALVEDERGRVEFRPSHEYRQMPRRLVLGQWFEDHPEEIQRGDASGSLPAFFENLIPEGTLRRKLETSLGVSAGDDLGLLCAVGGDLPGAVIVRLQEGGAPASVPERQLAGSPDGGMRFSLAGVQLKFSMVRQGERFAMPGRDSRGDWIAKISLDSYPTLALNEWLTMEWARSLGLDVPEVELRTLGELIDVPHEGLATSQVFMIRRYDRGAGGHRLHQEDFQQVVGRRSEKKYDDMSYEKLALLATKIVGESAWPELLRRLVFVVASGNGDAHMKNWSLLYSEGGVAARLSPLYDQVFTAQWPDFARELALKLGGTKDFAAIDLARFRELARRIGQAPEAAAVLVEQTVSEAAEAWAKLREHPNVFPEYRGALQRHWRKVPLLREHADAI